MTDRTVPDDARNSGEIRVADTRLVEFIRKVGRDSHEFRYLREALISSNLGALRKMGSWRALDELRRRGLSVPRPVPPSFHDEYPTLCFLAVHASIDGFLQRQVLEGGWRPEGGSSLRGYSRVSALYALVDQYRTYYRQETVRDVSLDQRRADGDDPDSDGCHGALVHPSENPEHVAIRRDSIRRKLGAADDRIKTILSLNSEGYTYREIAEMLGTTEDAISAALRRFRRRNIDDDSDDGTDGGTDDGTDDGTDGGTDAGTDAASPS